MLMVARQQVDAIVERRLDEIAYRVDLWLSETSAVLRESADRPNRVRALMVDAHGAGMLAETDFALFAWVAMQWPGSETAFRADPEVVRIVASDWRPEAKLVRIPALSHQRDEAKANDAV